MVCVNISILAYKVIFSHYLLFCWFTVHSFVWLFFLHFIAHFLKLVVCGKNQKPPQVELSLVEIIWTLTGSDGDVIEAAAVLTMVDLPSMRRSPTYITNINPISLTDWTLCLHMGPGVDNPSTSHICSQG